MRVKNTKKSFVLYCNAHRQKARTRVSCGNEGDKGDKSQGGLNLKKKYKRYKELSGSR